MILVGALSVTIAYAVFFILVKFGVYYQIASIFSFVTYWLINFTINRVWAFKSSGNIGSEAFKHMSLHLGNQLMIMAGLYILIELVGVAVEWAQVIMQVIATLTVFLITPLIFKGKK
jgi:putative flippase GtrA